MRKKRSPIEEYARACRKAGLTYGQMQQKESLALMTPIRAPRHYRKVSEWKEIKDDEQNRNV